jgi:N-acetylglucosaminyl-diphospho-decaprenol L-rhamnosyltransferase
MPISDTHQPNDVVTLSVVSHGHGALLGLLFDDLARHCGNRVHVVLTLNIPERLPFDPTALPFPVEVIENTTPKGFGANHNAAFGSCRTDAFCILNPDIRLEADPFPRLLDALAAPGVGLVAPRILSPAGTTEDSARRYPTVARLLRKALVSATRIDYDMTGGRFSSDWVAGMFMLVRREAFAAVRGLDERYFLYYEDVDLCRRLHRAGYDVVCVPEVSAIHAARRASRRDLKHMRWHLTSMARFLLSA